MASIRLARGPYAISRGNARVPRVLVLADTKPRMERAPYPKISHVPYVSWNLQYTKATDSDTLSLVS